MLQELIHRLVGRKIAIALAALFSSVALIVLSMFHADRETTVALVSFMGGPAVAACAVFIHGQSKIDVAETVAQSSVSGQ